MTRVFISYRREDSIAYAGRLCDHLAAHFGAEQVFMDIGQIEAGADFTQVLANAIAGSDVVLALIGPQWLHAANAQGRRLDQADDFVRYELAAALRQGKRLIPVLVGGARMPDAKNLPPALAELARRQAHELDDKRFQFDLDALIRNIERRPTLLAQFMAMLQAERLRRWRQLSVVAAALAMFLFGWVQLFDVLAIDTYLESYTLAIGDVLAPPSVSEQIVIVSYGEQTESRLGQPGPNWRDEHARVLDRLVDAGAAVIVFDLFFERPGPADERFVAAVERARQRGSTVIVGVRRLIDGRAAMVPGLSQAVGASGVLCLGGRLGYASTVPLAVVKHAPPKALADGGKMARFTAIGALAAGADVPAIDVPRRELALVDKSGRILWRGPLRSLGRQVEASGQISRDCPLLEDDDLVAEALIRLAPRAAWREPQRRYDYEQIGGATAFAPAGQLAGKIVLIGDSRAGADEFLVRRGLGEEWRHGVELHADVVNNLLQGIHVRGLAPTAQFLGMLGLAAVGGWLRLTGAAMPRGRRTLLLCAVFLLYLAVTVLAGTQFGLLFNTAYHIGAFLLAYALLGCIARRGIAG